MAEYNEGGEIRTGVCLVHNDTDVPEMVFSHSPLREQVEKSLRWIGDHYGPDGEFHCPGDPQ